MTKQFKSRWIILAGMLFISYPIRGQARVPSTDLAAQITLLTSDLHEDGEFTVRVQLQNTADHPVLVGRDFNRIYSMPFHMEIWLEDVAGNRLTPFAPEAVVDFLEPPDLQLENGLLKWRVPLYPNTFLGTDLSFHLSGIPPGKYTLRGKYVAGRPPHKDSKVERALLASRVAIFQGTVETNSIQVEVLPKTAGVAGATRGRNSGTGTRGQTKRFLLFLCAV